jgi:hypothetical protein
LRCIREQLKDCGGILRWPTGIISQNNNASHFAVN